MEQTLYRQRSETRYDNNEFEDMPSLDYGRDKVGLYKENMSLVDWQEVGRICEEYGFRYAVMHGTYGNTSKVIIYEKVNIDPDAFATMRKAKAYDVCWDMEKKAAPRYLQLHMCINELDRRTNLYFRCGWSGNCGLFGSMDVRRMSYSFGSHVTSWWEMTDRYCSACYNISTRPPKGVYLLMETDEAKIDTAYVFDDFTMEKALDIARELFPNEVIELRTGKRQCDTDMPSYQAIVIGQGMGQSGSLTFAKSNHGVVTMCRRAVLGGECSYKVKRDELRSELQEAIRYMLN